MRFNYKATLTAALLFFAVFIGAVYAIRTVSGTNLPVAAVQSGSMEPNIPTGSLIFIQSVSPSEIAAGPPPLGDTIVYILPNTKISDYFLFATYNPLPISHRVVNETVINGTYYFLTKGDANLYPDQNPSNPSTWVPEDRVVGKVVFSIPYAGYPFLWFKNIWLVSLVVVILLILILLPSSNKNSIGEREQPV